MTMAYRGARVRAIACLLVGVLVGALLTAPPASADARTEPAAQRAEGGAAGGDTGESAREGGGGLLDRVRGLFDRSGGDGEAAAAEEVEVGPRAERPTSGGLRVRQRKPDAQPMSNARVRELPGQRTATSKVFELEDGRLQSELSVAPVHYRDGDRWDEIDTRLRPASGGGFALENVSNSVASRFGASSDRLLQIDHGDRQVTLGLPGATRRATPDQAADVVRYRGLLGDADVEYQVIPGGVKESIVLDAPPEEGDAQFTFALGLRGLEAHEADDGSIGLYAKGSGDVPELVLPRPFMTDASEQVATPYADWSGAVTQSVTRREGATEVTITADGDWLRDDARTYPVVIDPTIIVAPTPTDAQDAMILSDAPDTNYDGNWRLSVGTSNSGKARSLLRFDVSQIPAGTQVDSATLELYYDQTFTTNANDVLVRAYKVTAPWDAATVTWNSFGDASGQQGRNREIVDNSDVGKVAAVGTWPASTNTTLRQHAINDDYQYNKNATTGETFTWVPRLTEDTSFRVDAHHVEGSDRSAAVPFTVHHSAGSASVTVDQTAGTEGMWTTLGTWDFTAGTTHSVEMGDVADGSKAVIADAVRFTKWASDHKEPETNNQWHVFTIRNLVQGWVNGSANHGVVLKVKNESTLGQGGPRYEASEYTYGGETNNRPKLVVTYGRPSVEINPIETITSTGPVIDWEPYADPDPNDDADDLVEYQIHRSVHQAFAPTASTLVAPVDAGTTTFTDTTAEPTPADDPDPFGRAYYYQVAVKTKDGQLVGSPTPLVRLPKAGRVTQIFPGAVHDTTLSEDQPDERLNVLTGREWLSVGNNSSTYGTTRAVVRFGDISAKIPAGATVLDGEMKLWAVESYGSGATFDVHKLTKKFGEVYATWNRRYQNSFWSTPGGDFDSTRAASGVTGITNDPERQTWNAPELVQEWLDDPSSNRGALFKLRNEGSGPAQRALFLSGEGVTPSMRPHLEVTYLEADAASTYHAPYTPARMIPGDTYPVEVTLTNTTSGTWSAGDRVLSYRWSLPDGTDVTTGGNQLETPLPEDMSPGETLTFTAQVNTPIQSDEGNKREAFVLSWDLRNTATGQWLSDSDGIGALSQDVTVEDPTSDQLGLESFYQYAGTSTGAGSAVLANLHAGNTVFGYNPLSNPSRGISTFLRLTYNSLDTSTSSAGYGWSLSASSLIRLGTPLDFHPPGQDWPTTVTLTDGDGTSHAFELNKHGSTNEVDWTYDAAAGVNLYLQPTGSGDTSRAWTMTSPDRTQFIFDDDGYLSAVADANGNELVLTWAERRSRNKPVKFLAYITDAAGRQTLTVDHYAKGQDYTYIDDAGARTNGTNLANPKIIDQVASITDISGRTVTFVYSDKGLLRELVDGAGQPEAKTFRFAYDATQGNKNVKLVAVTDPRGNTTDLAYYDAPTDPKDKWRLQKLTDRRDGVTRFDYVDPDAQAGSDIETTVTDAEGHASVYRTDGFGRPTRMVNAKGQTTKLAWDAENHVTRLEEPNGAFTTWTYDAKTGYPTSITDAEANAQSPTGPSTTLTYDTSLNGYVADLVGKTSPEGRTWAFDHDAVGNLTSVTDPKGTATATAGDYTTTYAYDGSGQLAEATDANGHTTTYSDYHPTGYPKTITDPLDNATTFTYDARGNVTTVTDAQGSTTTQEYDLFGRPGEQSTPKDADAGEFIVTSAPVYDSNDNVTTATAPNGAVTAATFDPADQVTAIDAPKDTPGGPQRRSTYVYDAVGNVTSETEPKGNLTAGDPDDFTTSYAYDEIHQLTSVTNADGDRITYDYDDVGNVVTVVDPRKTASADPDDVTTSYVYDRNHQVTQVTDAAGHTVGYAYDRDGATVSVTDQEGNTTSVTLDERAMVSQVEVPHSTKGTGEVIYRTTRFGYDQVGNRTTVETPRGVATAEPDDFTQRMVYDELNRVVEQVMPYDPADPQFDTPDKILRTYDAVGRVTKVSAPPSDGQSVRNDTRYTHFDNGWIRTSTDPWGINSSYDYNLVGQQTSRTVTAAGGATSRTMGWDYYPDGKLKARSDEGVPAGRHVVVVDSSDSQHVDTQGSWATATDGDGFAGYDYRTNAAGTGADQFTWNLVVPADGTYEVAVRYPSGVGGAATNAPYEVAHDGGTATQRVDQSQSGGQWASLGSWTFSQGADHHIRLTDDADGVVLADAVRLVRDTSGGSDDESKTFGYSYDANGNLTEITDASSGATVDAYALSYTGLNQVAELTESAGGTVTNTTSFTYDANGNPLTRTHDDAFAEYSYDERDLPVEVSNGDAPGDADPKVTTFTYTPRRQVQTETRHNGNVVDYTWFRDGRLRSQVETKPGGAVVSRHRLTYTLNGQRATDEVATMSAAVGGGLLEHTYSYTYDPRERIEQVTKAAPGGAVLATQTYRHDANSNVVSQTVDGTSTSFAYDRNRLQSATVDGVVASYAYDPFGRVDAVTAAGQVVEDYTYDGFDRVTEYSKLQQSGSTTTTSYVHDPLDRTVARTDDVGTADEQTRTLRYLGLSNEVVAEEVAGQLDRSYQYSAWGQRLSMVTHDDDGGGEETSYFGFNAHSDVEVLVDESGDTRATYGYTAYGQTDDDLTTGVDAPDPADPTAEPYNVYRFNNRRWDPASGTVDMGFRSYDPGLNRFLTRDTYNGALADLNLATDEWTGNRYAFAAGNPISRVELDGHAVTECSGVRPDDGKPCATAHNGTIVGDTAAQAAAKEGSSGGDGGGGGIGGWFGSGWDATRNFVVEHKAEIASAAAGVAVGVGCTIATGGTAVVGCAALGGAAAGNVHYAMSTPPQEQTIGGATLATLTGGALGAVGGYAEGAIAARIAGSAGGTFLGGGGGAATGAVSRAGSGGAGATAESADELVDLASAARRSHILDGHRYGAEAGNTWFPKGWSDDTIMHSISDITTDPSLTWVQQTGRAGAAFTRGGAPVRYTVEGVRDGVKIRVVLEPGGEGIITGFPIP
jgi:RHS repeat-associated protein